MDLFCPHCTRRVTVPDDKAGTVLNCPLCAKQFMAPSLAPAPIAPRPPVPDSAPMHAGSTYGLGVAPTSPPVSPLVPPVLSPAPSPMPPGSAPESFAAAPPLRPVPPGDYTRTYTFRLQSSWLAFVPSVCMGLILVLSVFTWHATWHANNVSFSTLSLWGLAFHPDHGSGPFLVYWLLFWICILLAVLALLLEKQWIFTPPPVDTYVKPLFMWKDLIVAFFLGVAFLPLAYDYFDAHFNQSFNPMALALKLVVRLHLLALIASLLMFWLHWRRMSNAPLPKGEFRW